MKRLKLFKLTGLLTAVIMIPVILSSCGTAGLTAPTDLTAADPDSENPNRIELSWLPVDGAGIYYVYRDTEESGTFSTNAGFSVTGNEDADGVMRYYFRETFDEGEGGTYWYKVTAAASSDISLESAMSGSVDASTYSGTWSSASDSVLGSAGQLSLAAGTASLYAVYGSTDLTAKEYAEDVDSEEDDPQKIWTALTGSPGTTNAAFDSALVFSTMVSGGDLYVAFADAGADVEGAVSMQYYYDSSSDDTPSYEWAAAGSPGFNEAAATNITVATAGGFSTDIYTAFMESTDATMYKNNVEIDLSASIADVSGVESLYQLNSGTSIYLGYDYSDGLYLREYDTTFQILAEGGLVTASDIDDGNAVFVSDGTDLYAVYIVNGGGLEVRKYEDGSWSGLTEITTASDLDRPGTLAAHWFNGYLYIFYVDSSDSCGHVKYYSETDGWQDAAIGSGALTGSTALGSFQLESDAADTELYAGYVEDGTAYLRVLE